MFEQTTLKSGVSRKNEEDKQEAKYVDSEAVTHKQAIICLISACLYFPE